MEKVMANGFSDASKAGIAVLQRLDKVRLEPQMCPWCKVRPADEVDHIMARANGGTNSAFNGMYICAVCNRRKSAQPLDDWMDHVRRTYTNPQIE
jgi:5-methylcytosine-specific restriction endonuclease McrA